MELNDAADVEQAQIDWAEDMIEDFKPTGVDIESNGDVDVDDEEAPELESEAESVDDEKTDDVDVDASIIGKADYAKMVSIESKDGTVVQKSIQQLIDEGMYKTDYTKKTQELAREREQLRDDKSIIELLNTDKHARTYLEKRIQDIKDGKAIDADDDIVLPEELLEQVPGFKKLLHKVKEHDIEISKSRTNAERTQADQTVGKIDSVMKIAQAAIEKELGLKLEPGVFRARVGKNIIESLDDNVPEDRKVPIAGQMILTDKKYFLSKARESYQQEIELAKEKAIDAARKDRADKADKTKSLKGGGTKTPSGELGDFKMVKDKYGRPDMDAFLEDAFSRGGKARK